jgi:hypothetical protein
LDEEALIDLFSSSWGKADEPRQTVLANIRKIRDGR